MELKEMIKVMQHFEDGGVVEFSDNNFNTTLGESNKEDDGELCWNWDSFDYRIKEQKQKVTIEKWLCKDKFGDFITVETSNIDRYVLYKKIKLIKSYKIEVEGE